MNISNFCPYGETHVLLQLSLLLLTSQTHVNAHKYIVTHKSLRNKNCMLFLNSKSDLEAVTVAKARGSFI